jgi:7-keto-8-aminopelargonate synthetase-like enzyme
MADAIVEEIDGRRIRIGDHWLTDFASCNYLGFDLDPEIIEGIPPYLRRWGTHPSWSRLVCNPALFEEVEDELRRLLGVDEVLCLPTLTILHANAIPVLSAGGTIWVDERAHRTLVDPCLVAKCRGTDLRSFRHNDHEDLARQLRAATTGPRLIVMDGVHSMTGNAPDLAEFARTAREHGALLYIDDAHGFGVLGERTGADRTPYGSRGNAIVRHFGESYDSILLTSGFSKAYSSLLAFITCSPEVKGLLKVAAPAYAYSGPPPIAALAAALLGLRINAARGDDVRGTLYRRSRLVLEHLDKLGVATRNESSFPIITVAVAEPATLFEAGQFLYDRGIYVTLTPYPVVPRTDVGFRIQVTAANTDEQIDHLNEVLTEVRDRFGLRATYA